MGSMADKLFMPVAGRALIAHTWQRLDAAADIDEIILVARPGMQAAFSDLAAHCGLRKPFKFAEGGPERQDSVWNGLEALPANCEIVLIQDGARPCTAPSLILETIKAARAVGAAVAAQRVTDTIKESNGGNRIVRTLDRTRLWAVQTPQTFQVAVIRRALAAVRQSGLVVTDDTAACELIGQPVQLVESTEPNPKATAPADLPFIEMLLRNPNLAKTASAN